jgi:hypothetical protein
MNDLTALEARKIRDEAINRIERQTGIQLRLTMSDAISAARRSSSVQEATEVLVGREIATAAMYAK